MRKSHGERVTLESPGYTCVIMCERVRRHVSEGVCLYAEQCAAPDSIVYHWQYGRAVSECTTDRRDARCEHVEGTGSANRKALTGTR